MAKRFVVSFTDKRMSKKWILADSSDEAEHKAKTISNKVDNIEFVGEW